MCGGKLGWINGWKDCQVGDWMEGVWDGWMDGWMDGEGGWDK